MAGARVSCIQDAPAAQADAHHPRVSHPQPVAGPGRCLVVILLPSQVHRSPLPSPCHLPAISPAISLPSPCHLPAISLLNYIASHPPPHATLLTPPNLHLTPSSRPPHAPHAPPYATHLTPATLHLTPPSSRPLELSKATPSSPTLLHLSDTSARAIPAWQVRHARHRHVALAGVLVGLRGQPGK